MKKVGLALGSGSFKGFAHVGILKEFEKNKVPVDYIAGSSAGSVIGAFYASGMKTREIEKIIYKTNWKSLLDFVLPNKGFLAGKKFERYIRRLINGARFEDLNIPLQLVATDLRTGKKVVFNKGDVASAIRASSSIPVIFEPQKYNRMLLVDGGIIDPVPVDVVRDMGAEYVIACDVCSPVSTTFKNSKNPGKFNETFRETFFEQELENISKYLHMDDRAPIVQFLFKPSKIVELFKGSNSRIKLPEFLKYNGASLQIMADEIAKYKIKEADVVIHPCFNGILPLDTTHSRLIVEGGRKAARKKISKILKDIQ